MSGNLSLQKIFSTDNSPLISPNKISNLDHLQSLLQNLSAESIRSSNPNSLHDLLTLFISKCSREGDFQSVSEVAIGSYLFGHEGLLNKISLPFYLHSSK